MSVWSVYFLHWASTSNQLRCKEYSRKSTIKTIKTIYLWFSESYQSTEYISFEDCAGYLSRVLPVDLPTLVMGVEDRIRLLQELVERLCPRHTPDDSTLFSCNVSEFDVRNGQIERGQETPWHYSSPSEHRLKKNLGLLGGDFSDRRQVNEWNFSGLGLTGNQVRSVDAIVALM